MPGMKLGDWLENNSITDDAFALLLSPVSASGHTVKKWVRGERIPRQDAMVRIQEVTGGVVQPNDFYSEAQGVTPDAAE